jgi:GPI ethanolamine phosphate transferase 1
LETIPIAVAEHSCQVPATMAGSTRARFLAVAVIFHFVYIFSIFDIYFVSPIVTGMTVFPIQRETKAPADRLVLFVGGWKNPSKLSPAHLANR